MLLNIELLFMSFILSAAQNEEKPIIEFSQGKLLGRLSTTIGKNKPYSAFLGIPYAEPPIGELRFEAPVPKRPWNGNLDATVEGRQCTQSNNPVRGSEDCLYANVYVPKVLPNEELLLPVMVYIHEGRYIYGNSSYDLYGPDYFLDEEIIVVTFNYRLGIFGFFSTGDLVVPGNNALKDQVLLLKWVQENILKFGGNPKNVVLYGSGGGAACVSYHLQSQQSNGLFVGAIMQSGVSLCVRLFNRQFKKFKNRLAEKLSLNSSNSVLFTQNLKKIDAKELQSAIWDENLLEFFKKDPMNDLLFGPVVEPEHTNAFFTKNSHEVLAAGNFFKVPCIIGVTSLLMALYPISYLPPEFWSLLFDMDKRKLVPIDLNVDSKQEKEVASILKAYYFPNMSITSSETNFRQFLSDKYYMRPIRDFVRFVSKKVPVYYYIFAYEGNLGGVANRSQPGVALYEDMPYLWRRKNSSNPTLNDVLVRQKMVSWWSSFVKFLNPTPENTIQSNDIIWKNVDSKLSYLEIKEKPEMKEFPEKENMEVWDSIYSKYGYRSFYNY